MLCSQLCFGCVAFKYSPDLSPEDKEVKRQLSKCCPRVYSDLIKLDILGPSGVGPSRPPTLRSSLPPAMKSSHGGSSL